MSQPLFPIISSQELRALEKSGSVILIDSRHLNALSNFKKAHLKGALFVDLNNDLAEIDNPRNGGRHPLPTVPKFVSVLNELGISNSSHVVIYDESNGAFAARFWWMLRAVGHKKVQVLNGGFDFAVKNGFPVQSGDPVKPKESSYIANGWSWPIVDMEMVEKATQNPKNVVVDVRSEQRFNGEFEPIDLIAGHIPGAINIPFSTNLQSDGTFLSVEELTKKYAGINSEFDEVIFHCGSGVTACHSILAMEMCDFETPRLYVGSWSEWSRNKT